MTDTAMILYTALQVIAGSSTAYLRGWCQRHCRTPHDPVPDRHLRRHVASAALALYEELRWAAPA